MEITSIIQHVFKQPSLEGVSLSELERFTAKQPFFAVGQYLLLKKMQDIRDPGFDKQLQKTRLYFENPLWLQQLLLKKTDGAIVTHTNVEPTAPEAESIADEREFEGSDIVGEQTDKIEKVSYAGDEIIVEEAMIAEVKEDFFEDSPHPDPFLAEPVQEIQHINRVELEELKAEKAEVENTGQPVAEIVLPEPAEEIPETVSTAETVPATENSESTENPEVSRELTENEEGKPGFVLPIYSKPIEQTEEKLVFQAYHTIDYFASQGIKISNKAEMSDKLGSQLKSFTEWLKTMKRLPPSKLEQQMEEKDSEVVVEMAAHSLESKEVLTETMAEVLLKQGKKESAIEVYNKLSLLNPSKTPYFAAKIEAIKQN